MTHQKMQFSENNSICGVLFDGAWLWEEYINTLISNLFIHTRNKAKDGKSNCQWLFTNDKETKVGLIYPDFIRNDLRIIGDAKYKQISGIKSKDYLQMLAYMFRFNSNSGVWFYPFSKKDDKNKNGSDQNSNAALDKDEILYLNQGLGDDCKKRRNPEICLKKLGFEIPTISESYEKFIETIKGSEDAFVKAVEEYVNGVK
ncbi:MAG: hypothetical protein ACI4NE_08115 [Succinivibrio sp.]